MVGKTPPYNPVIDILQLSQHLKPVDRKFCDKSFAESEISTPPVFTGGIHSNPDSNRWVGLGVSGERRLTMGLIHPVFSVRKVGRYHFCTRNIHLEKWVVSG